MTDEKDDVIGERAADAVAAAAELRGIQERLKAAEADAAEEQRIRISLMQTQRKVLIENRERDHVYHADWIVQNSPEERREWQRHQVAVAAMNGLLVGAELSVHDLDRPGLGIGKAGQRIAECSYQIAEAMMAERERRKGTP